MVLKLGKLTLLLFYRYKRLCGWLFFKLFFYSEIYYNNIIFYFFKIIFDITHQNDSKT
jgi:hypothetical protein